MGFETNFSRFKKGVQNVMRNQCSVNETLKIFGGAPVRQEPFSSWPRFDDEQIEAATTVLKTGRVNYWTGTEGKRFEQEFAKAVGATYAVAVANGTVALELALQAVGIGSGDEVVVPCRTFVATASSVVVRGAVPVFADIDPISQNVNAETIEAVLTPRTRAIIVVHLAGWPCDMEPILELARRRNLKVIEDCAQAHGASYKGQPVGSLGDLAAFSFCQDKIITTGGEGGMVTMNDKNLWHRCWSYKDHGKSWDAVQNARTAHSFVWLHHSIGTNWRMTEMQSAIGRIALRRLPEWVRIRRQNANALSAGLSAVPGVSTAVVASEFRHSYYKYYALLDLDRFAFGWTRDEFTRALQAEGIPCGSGCCPEVYREQAFAELRRPAKRFAVAAELGLKSVMLQVHPTLGPSDMADTCRAFRKVMSFATTTPLPTAKRAA